ncbi:MAG: hypothetical protein U5K69_17870 [Balneolaceae bacterium]|nr:hypothetical protein [Balneolaceae bacterium]
MNESTSKTIGPEFSVGVRCADLYRWGRHSVWSFDMKDSEIQYINVALNPEKWIIFDRISRPGIAIFDKN